MGFFSAVGWFDIRWWIWCYFFFSVVAGIAIGIYWNREALKRIYLQVRFPERVIKVIVHYKSNMYNVYWRLIPDNNFFKINKKMYYFDDREVLKQNDFFTRKDKDKKTILKIDGKKYNFEDLAQIKNKGKKWTEIHYFYNNPTPLSFDFTSEDVDFSSKQMTDFEENDLFVKLLTLAQERNVMMIVIILVVLNTIISFVMLAKMMGWLK